MYIEPENEDLMLLQWGAVVGASLVGAVTDLRRRRIPNWLTLPLWGAGLAFATWLGGLGGLLEALVAAGALALPFVVLFVVASGGAGDAKLMGAIGAWLGLVDGLIALLAVMASGAVCGLAYAAVKGQFAPVWARMREIVASVTLLAVPEVRSVTWRVMPPKEEMLPFPYGVAICVGVCMAALGRYLWI